MIGISFIVRLLRGGFWIVLGLLILFVVWRLVAYGIRTFLDVSWIEVKSDWAWFNAKLPKITWKKPKKAEPPPVIPNEPQK